MPEIIDFLLGSGTLDGWGYGETPGKTGAFWWRKHLREYHEGVAAKLEAAAGMAEALGRFSDVKGARGYMARLALAHWQSVNGEKS